MIQPIGKPTKPIPPPRRFKHIVYRRGRLSSQAVIRLPIRLNSQSRAKEDRR
ncbi:MAG: hypothetical protein ABSB12_00835 [Candidatus Saccharimonadales bacterium]